MEKFIQKYSNEIGDKFALDLIKRRAVEMAENHHEGENYGEKLKCLYIMVRDLMESKGIEMPAEG